MNETFNDCYAVWDESRLLIGNSRIERRYGFGTAGLHCVQVEDKALKTTWTNPDEPPVTRKPAACCCETTDNGGLAADHLAVTVGQDVSGGLVETRLEVFPGLPFVVTTRRCRGIALPPLADCSEEERALWQALDRIDNLPLGGRRHLRLHATRLWDLTDLTDTFATSEETGVYVYEDSFRPGHVFLLNDYPVGQGVLLVKEAPTASNHLQEHENSLAVERLRQIALVGCGLSAGGMKGDDWTMLYGSAVGVGHPDTLLAEYRRLCRAQNLPVFSGTPFIMSNTWGDHNQDSRMGEEFIIKEIEAGARLGVDVIQLDDGWEKGITMNSKRKSDGVWEGYYEDDPDFWQVNPERFPHGLKPLVKLAGDHGLKIGLWFSPDSSHEFANWERDVATILGLHRDLGVDFFKLDGVNLLTKQSEANYFKLLDAIMRGSRNRIILNLDTTAQSRPGYLLGKEYGTLFVENRYTDLANYYPHRTLKNLWMLSHFMPPGRLQFEVLNNRRNDAAYNGDPLRPSTYSIAYEFASVMLANPLMWMELSNLSEEQVEELRPLIALYRGIRSELVCADVHPIGQEPDGFSLTGFQAVTGKDTGYLFLFQENPSSAPSQVCMLARPLPPKVSVELLAGGNGEDDRSAFLLDENDPGVIGWQGARRSFAICRYRGI